MQIMPVTARQHAGLGLGQSTASLQDPATNMSYGQKHLEMLRDASGTQGLLPKIMAAYNAGLSPVQRWNTEINAQGDPLLWMESIPYWETRGYVAIVMHQLLDVPAPGWAAIPTRARPMPRTCGRVSPASPAAMRWRCTARK